MKLLSAISSAHINIKTESVQIILGALMLFASGQLAIPIEPVPIVMTTVGVMIIGLLYERKTALKTVLLYISAGACGAPVFQDFAGGIAQLYGPTGGYIIGFACAVLVMTSIRDKFNLNSFWGILTICTIGTVVIFIPGVLWLSILLNFKQAIEFGVLPFILPGALKAVLLSGAIRVIRPRSS